MDHHHHHHHHGEGEGEGEGVQCDHTKGVPHHPLGEGEDGMDDDPLFHKQEWSLDDWVEMYNKFTEPPSAAKGEASRELVQHVGELLPSEPARVLVPLCGKSPDLRWLYERGNTVVGIEGVEKVVREFFELYPDLQHTVEDLAFGKLYRSGDGRLLVYVCNIVKVPEGILGPCNAVFDWGAYTAIRPSDRPRYVEVVKSALREHFNYFLEVCHDGPPDAVGLPHSISFRSIKLELGTSLKMRVLKTLDISAEWGVESFFNSYILLSTKDT